MSAASPVGEGREPLTSSLTVNVHHVNGSIRGLKMSHARVTVRFNSNAPVSRLYGLL